jgi:hypothetical protein
MLYNSNQNAPMLEGKCYYRKSNGRISVRKILGVRDKKISYQRIYGPPAKLLNTVQETNPQRFRKWMHGEIIESADFKALDGAHIHPTFIVHSFDGVPLFRCSQKRANFYLRRGYATKIKEDSIRFTEAGKRTEIVLQNIYGDISDHPFFMAPKNDKCVVCGKPNNLTKHHIVPRRHIKKINHTVSCCLSNVLFVCVDCHTEYERHSEQEPNNEISDSIDLVKAWRDHFLTTMKPRFLPDGWDIFSTDPHEICAG